MIVNLIDGPLPKLTLYGYPIAAPSRSSDHPHVTPIIIQFLRNLGKYPYSDTEGENPIRDMLFECGFVWEELLSYAFATRMVGVRTPELLMDGVALSPDGVTTSGVDLEKDFDKLFDGGPVDYEDFQFLAGPIKRLEEYKFTKRSIPIPKGEDAVLAKFFGNDYWMMQAMAYCRAVGTTICRHHVMHIMGDYKWGDDGNPIVYQIYETEFEEEEIEINWEIIVREGKEMGVL